jgi:hypothetical protein
MAMRGWYILKLVSLLFELFGLSWLLLIVMVAILGGTVVIKIKNPFTKEMESITEVTIDHETIPAD